MKRTYIFTLYLLFFLLFSSLSLSANSYLGYTVLSANTNQSRGTSRNPLFSFGISLSGNVYTQVELKSITFYIDHPTVFPLTMLSSLYLYSTNSGIQTQLSSSIADWTTGRLQFVINQTTYITKNQTNIFHISADIQNYTNNNSVNDITFVLSNNAAIQATPSASLSISNLQNGSGALPNKEAALKVWDKHVVFTTATNLITYPATIERGDTYLWLAFTLSNKNYAQTKASTLLSSIVFTSLMSNTKTISIYQDNGDNSFNSANDSLLVSQTVSSNLQIVTVPSGIYLPNGDPILFWVTAQIHPNAEITGAPNFFLTIASNYQYRFNGWSSYSLGNSINIASQQGTIDDTKAPQASTGTTITTGNNAVLITWTNAQDIDLYKVRILYKSGSAPTGFTDGLAIATDIDVANQQGKISYKKIDSLINGNTYYFLIYSYDAKTNLSPAIGAGGTLNAVPSPIATAPVNPGGVQITPYNNRFELQWQPSSDSGHQYYLIQCSPSSGGMYNFTNYSTFQTIYLTNLGYGSSMSQHYSYFSVVGVNLDGTTSPNYSANASELTSKGTRIAYNDVSTSTGVVYNNFFRPDFGESARIIINMQRRGTVKIKIYSIAGELTKTIANRILDAGKHEFKWQGTATSGSLVNPGLYLVHIRFNDVNIVKKVVVRR